MITSCFLWCLRKANALKLWASHRYLHCNRPPKDMASKFWVRLKIDCIPSFFQKIVPSVLQVHKLNHNYNQHFSQDSVMAVWPSVMAYHPGRLQSEIPEEFAKVVWSSTTSPTLQGFRFSFFLGWLVYSLGQMTGCSKHLSLNITYLKRNIESDKTPKHFFGNSM